MPLNNPLALPFIIQIGQSSSETAKSGVDVVFDSEYPTVPKLSLCAWQEERVWVTEVTTTGFTWAADEDASTIDWVAIGKNG